MNILIITPYLPWPLKTGGNAAMFSTIRCLADDHRFTLVCPISESQLEDANTLKLELPFLDLRAVVCSEAKSSGNLFRRFVNRSYRWILRKVEPAPVCESLWDPFAPVQSELVIAIAAELEKKPDCCQVEFAEMMSIVSLLPKSIPKIFVHHQIHFIYNNLTRIDPLTSAYVRYLVARQKVIEIAHLQEYSAVISFSKDDRMTLEAEATLPPVYDSGFPVPADVGITSDVPTEFNRELCYLGSQEHLPNREGLDWLLAEIWPKITAKLANIELVVFGTWSDDWKKRAELCPGKITFKGFVPDLGTALRGGILVVPLRVGSGIRTKILAGLAQGLPCVATTIAAEGLPTGDEGGIIRADTQTAFVDAVVDLAMRPDYWKLRAAAGPEYIKNFHSPEAVRRRRNEIYQAVMKIHDPIDSLRL